jgi:nucleotide-binding universal stress UspA family protein
MIRKILVPLDGSRLAEKALPYAQSLAEKYEAELILVQAIPPAIVMPIGEFGVLPHDLGPVRDAEAQTAAEYLEELEEKLRAEGLTCRSLVLKDLEVADAIVDIASEESVDVIVKTTHGRSGLSRWVYGSVATKVLQQAPCPVFLIRVRA